MFLNVEVARSYTKRGWAIIPLHSPVATGCSCGNTTCIKSAGKHPRTRTGLKEASLNEERATEWWTAWPNANIGIVTGEISNLLVVDIDPRHGGDQSWELLEAQHGKVSTVAVITGSGGRHYYFCHPGRKIGNTSNRLGPGIDTRGDGGYIVAPGSIHKTGKRYEWAPGASPNETLIAPAPEWLLDLIERPKKPDYSNQRVQELTAIGVRHEDDDLPAPHVDAILECCAWLRHTRDDAATLSEPEWYAMLSILGRCEEGTRLAHDWSRPHSFYSYEETSQKLRHAVESAGPRTCRDIYVNGGEPYCAECPQFAKIKSPIVLGRQDHLMEASKAFRKYGIKVDGRRYVLAETGVYPVRQRDGAYKPDWSSPIATRPIHPAAHGFDLATRTPWIQLAWFNSKGETTTRWLPDAATNDRSLLLSLDDAPVSLGRINHLSDWLADAKAWVGKPSKTLSTRLGWVGGGADSRFVLPGHPDVEYIGPELASAGSIDGWAAPLESVLAMSQAGFLALAVIGLSAAAPMVRLLGKRNPVIGLVAESSQGKGTVINYALSIWGPPPALTVPAGSTVKGLQDRGINSPDLPLFADEVQQLLKMDPRRVEDAIYYLGNGQRRVTSSKSQLAVGGERRYGVGFYAAEEPVTHALQLGAQYRVVELGGPPLATEAQAIEIQAATQANYGVVGRKIADRAYEDRELGPRQIRASAEAIKGQYPGIKGEDSYTLALISYGLRELTEIAGEDLPASKVVEWLASTLDESRAQTIDRHTAAWRSMIESVQGLAPGVHITNLDNLSLDGDAVVQGGHFVAWRGHSAEHASGGVEINPRAPMIEALLKPFGGGDACSRVWAARGWIERKGDELKCRRRQGGRILRVWRVTAEGMLAAGFDPAQPTQTPHTKNEPQRAS